MAERITMWIESLEVADGRAAVRGQVWLGPVREGAVFTAATTAGDEQPVQLRVEEIEAPAAAQEPGRVPRVFATLAGDGVDRLEAGVVLVGEIA